MHKGAERGTTQVDKLYILRLKQHRQKQKNYGKKGFKYPGAVNA